MLPAQDNHEARRALNEIIRGRRTVHDFQPEPVPDFVILDALEAARWAPNHHRTEPWRVYLLGPLVQKKISALNAELVQRKQGEKAAAIKLKRWNAVPGWLLLTSLRNADPQREREDYAACCCMAQNLMLTLWAAEVGCKWTTGAVTNMPELAQLVGFDPALEVVVGLFWYGRALSVPDQHRRAAANFLVRVD